MGLYREELNDSQYEAVTTTDGAVLVLAGAGTGKTRVITYRIAYLIKHLGVTPGNILAVTFTNKAAGEMKHRLKQLVDNLANAVHMGTFHSICLGILRNDGVKVGVPAGFAIVDQDDRLAIVKDVIKRMDLDPKKYPPKQYLNAISTYKNTYSYVENMTPPQDALVRFGEAFNLYQEVLQSQRQIDFDDMISLTVRLLVGDEETRKAYQELYQYILVDEYQDTNMVQFKLLYLLAGDNGNLCVVGDDDQSIYGWRGAEIRNILEFDKMFDNVKEIKLMGNYRSGSKILDMANKVIKNNEYRRGKTLNACRELVGEIEYQALDRDNDEAEFVANRINNIKCNAEDLSDVAILYRTNAQSRAFESSLSRYAIPYKVIGGLGFYQRREIKDILSYLRVYANTYDVAAFKRSIKTPSRGIGDGTIDKIVKYGVENNVDLITALKENVETLGRFSTPAQRYIALMDGLAKCVDIKSMIEYVVEEVNYKEYLKITESEHDAEQRLENVEELYSAAAGYEEEVEHATLDDFLANTSLVTTEEDSEEGVVKLMSLHTAKGLEFKHVFLTGLEEGLFPLNSEGDSGIEEERRLCYVGITRAMDKLYVTSVSSRFRYGERKFQKESRFLQEMFGANKRKPVNYDVPVSKQNFAGESAPVKKSNGKFKVSENVTHRVFGEGLVLMSEGSGTDEKVTVKFHKSGIKKILAGFLTHKV